jgi:hypothetical protein
MSFFFGQLYKLSVDHLLSSNLLNLYLYIKLIEPPKYCTVSMKNRQKGTSMNRCYVHAALRRIRKPTDDKKPSEPTTTTNNNSTASSSSVSSAEQPTSSNLAADRCSRLSYVSMGVLLLTTAVLLGRKYKRS